MTANTLKNGNEVYWSEKEKVWKYADGQIADDKTKPCPKCKKLPNAEGRDYCFGNLPGVKYACCGHGKEDGYIIFENGTTIRFRIKSVDRAQ